MASLRHEAMMRPLICLTMIVRNEARGIVQTLESVREHVDARCIVDTGSTDGTPVLVAEAIPRPGWIVHRPFIDFATTRNLALDIASDQDWHFEAPHPLWLLMLSGDAVVERPELLRTIVERAEAEGCIAVRLQLRNGGFTHTHVDLVKAGTGCRFVGKVHEAMVVPHGGKTHDATASGLIIRYTLNEERDAIRWQADVKILEGELAGLTPDQRREATRTLFYLAQTYECLGHVTRAIALYEERVTMGGYDEERFIAQLRVARLKEGRLDKHIEIIIAYWAAITMRPNRAEPPYWLSRFYTAIESPLLAYELAVRAAALPLPDGEALFVNADVYEWRAKDCLAVAAYHVGRFWECIDISTALLASGALPLEERPRILKNIDESRRAIVRGDVADEQRAAP